MAIKSNYIAEEFGITASEAYTKLASFNVDNIDKVINIFTETYYSIDARNSSKKVIGNNFYQLVWIENFTFNDIYSTIKAQPEFAGAIDII